MKCGPFAPGGLCCPADQHYYDPLRLPLGRPHHFPGSPVIGGASLPAAPQATGPRRLSRVPRTTIRTFNAQYAGGFLSARSWTKDAFRGLRRGRTGSAPPIPRHTAGLSDDAYSGFTCVADRTVDPAPLRTRPLGHARGLHYQGPRRLPGPDSHRQAAPNLSLLRHVDLPFLMAPEQSRRTRPTQKRDPPGTSRLLVSRSESERSTVRTVASRRRHPPLQPGSPLFTGATSGIGRATALAFAASARARWLSTSSDAQARLGRAPSAGTAVRRSTKRSCGGRWPWRRCTRR
jgi:hypothetical protein